MKTIKNLRSVVCTCGTFTKYPNAQKTLRNRIDPKFDLHFLNLDQSSAETRQRAVGSCDILIADTFETEKFESALSGSNLQWIHATTAGVNLLMENPHFKVQCRFKFHLCVY